MAVIRHVASGRKQPGIAVAFSMNHGKSWQKKDLLPGQSLPIPPHCTDLLVNSVPCDPSATYEIRDGGLVRL